MYYIGIDVSKKDLSVFDGKDLKFINQEGLKSFKKYLKKKYLFKKWSSKGRIFKKFGSVYDFGCYLLF
jgi:hypothetical protein